MRGAQSAPIRIGRPGLPGDTDPVIPRFRAFPEPEHPAPCDRIPHTAELVADAEMSPGHGVDRAASRTAGSGSAARLAAISSARRVKEATALTK